MRWARRGGERKGGRERAVCLREGERERERETGRENERIRENGKERL
jgi:hypothetical protein